MSNSRSDETALFVCYGFTRKLEQKRGKQMKAKVLDVMRVLFAQETAGLQTRCLQKPKHFIRDELTHKSIENNNPLHKNLLIEKIVRHRVKRVNPKTKSTSCLFNDTFHSVRSNKFLSPKRRSIPNSLLGP